MIEKISIKNVASYNSQVEIDNLRKINFFYGNNGSGKTTISRILYNEGILAKNSTYADCDIVNNSLIDSEILVFNSDFVERNFNQREHLKGIFTLDEKNEEVEKRIEEETTKQNGISDWLTREDSLMSIANIQLKSIKDNVKKDLWDIKNETLKKFQNFKLDAVGTKDKYFIEISRRFDQDDIKSIDDKDIISRYKKYFLQDLKKSNFLKTDVFSNIEKDINAILQEIVIGNKDVDIAALIKELDNSSWVEHGKNEYVYNKKIAVCPFCQKPLDDSFRNSLEKYFDKSYVAKKQALTKLLSSYIDKSKEFIKNIDSIILCYDDEKRLSIYKQKLEKIFSRNIQTIETKLSSMNLKSEILIIDEEEMNSLNKDLISFNKEVAEIVKNKEKVREDIWFLIAKKSKNRYDLFSIDSKKEEKTISKCKRKIKRLKIISSLIVENITSLYDKTVNTQKAVDGINILLKGAGFTGFIIEKKEDIKDKKLVKYYLNRTNRDEKNIFSSLSEGEKQFISFLYFYQMCLGTIDKENSASKKIIVLDDPISSMDSQVLFLVSTLIRQLAKKKKGNFFENENILQMFILTHNVFFYKEVSGDFGGYMVSNQSHYLVEKIKEITDVKYIDTKCFLSTDYEQLWKEIKKDGIDRVSLMNTLRRILESYVKFMHYGKSSWEACKTIENSPNKLLIARALISNINEGSHSVGVNDAMYFNTISDINFEDIKSVFKSLFSEIPGGKEHYELMLEDKK